MTAKLRIGVLISGSGTNLQAILDTCDSGKVDGKVVVVGSDRQDATGLDRAIKAGVPTFVVDYRDILGQYRRSPTTWKLPADADLAAVQRKQHLLDPRSEQNQMTSFLAPRIVAESRLLDRLAPYEVDLLVLAGFMRNLTPYFIDGFNTDPMRPRIMNIHPALLPAFPGVDGYGDTYRYGCKVGGCTVHFIDYGEDSGPIIAQKAFTIEEGDTLASVREKGLALEWRLYPQCIQWFAQGRLQLVTLTHTMDGGSERSVMRRRVVKIIKDKATEG
jgi:phosphoribosylglycinamide formyltransferase-1